MIPAGGVAGGEEPPEQARRRRLDGDGGDVIGNVAQRKHAVWGRRGRRWRRRR